MNVVFCAFGGDLFIQMDLLFSLRRGGSIPIPSNDLLLSNSLPSYRLTSLVPFLSCYLRLDCTPFNLRFPWPGMDSRAFNYQTPHAERNPTC